jgi:DNA invertase Pin-like site-specific DNA recombinase
MRAALHARVSTDKQAEKYGIPSQVEALRKGCLEREWLLVFDGDKDAFVDDGYSGAELDRPALNRLRQAAREGGGLISYLIAGYFLKVSSQAADFTSLSKRYLR